MDSKGHCDEVTRAKTDEAKQMERWQFQILLPVAAQMGVNQMQKSMSIEEYTNSIIHPITICFDDKCSTGDMLNRSFTYNNQTSYKHFTDYEDAYRCYHGRYCFSKYIVSDGCDLATVRQCNFKDVNLNQNFEYCVRSNLTILVNEEDRAYYKIFGLMTNAHYYGYDIPDHIV